jgi:hypothetical protein
MKLVNVLTANVHLNTLTFEKNLMSRDDVL